jgi:hypothetical protein
MTATSAAHRNPTGLGIFRAARWVLFLALMAIRPLIGLAFALVGRLCLVGVVVNLFALRNGNLAAVWFALASLGCMAGPSIVDLLLQALAPPSKDPR